jgi:cysteine-rich repeat protein
MRRFYFLLPLLLALGPRLARSQHVACDALADFPCGLQVQDQALQRAPALFRLQARVAQAGLQIGEAQFEKVMVKVLRGTEVLCREQFQEIRIKASVMNLEIGAEIDCELDEIMARHTDLDLQLCIGTDETCLPPIPLQSTPYAVRATWAWASERAHRADQAAQAHYAHRFSADRDLRARNTLGAGYFDTETRGAEAAAALYDAAEYEAYADSGFLQWTPVRHREAMTLHVAGKHHGTDRLSDLDEVVLSSGLTRARGDLRVVPRTAVGLEVADRGAHVTGPSEVDGGLRVVGAVTMEQDLDVKRPAQVGGDLTVGAGMHVQSSLGVTGSSDVQGLLTVDSATTVTGGAQIAGDAKVLGRLTVTAPDAAAGVHGDLDVLGEARFSENVHVLGDADATTSIQADTAYVHGDASLGSLDLGLKLTVSGDVTFTQMASFLGGTSKPDEGADQSFVQYEDEDREITLGGLVVAGSGAALGADLDGGMNTLKGARLELAAAPPSACTVDAEGLTYVDMSLHSVRLCTGGAWKSLGGGGGGFLCGNAFVQPGEGCDDGDLEAGDGCDPTCQVEDGWACPSGACQPLCGDGQIVGGETCDDSDVDPDDGCTALCQVTLGWVCEGEPSDCQIDCGDGIVLSEEPCDDGNEDPDDGCTPTCEIMAGWSCSDEQPSLCEPIPLAVPGYEGVDGPDLTMDGLALCGGAGPDDLALSGPDFFALCEGYGEIVFVCSVDDDAVPEQVSEAFPVEDLLLGDELCDEWAGAAVTSLLDDLVLAVDPSDPGCDDYDNSYELFVHFGAQWACMGQNTTPGYLGQRGGRVWAFVRYP